MSNLPSSGAFHPGAQPSELLRRAALGMSTGSSHLLHGLGTVLQNPCHRPFLNALGCIPIGGGGGQEAYRAGLEVLEEGYCLAVFPEGHRSRDGSLLNLQLGAARMAHLTGAPIVPVSVVGAFEAWPRNRMLPRPFRPITVKYHRPIPCPVVPKDQLRVESRRTTEKLGRVLRRRLAAWEVVRRRVSGGG